MLWLQWNESSALNNYESGNLLNLQYSLVFLYVDFIQVLELAILTDNLVLCCYPPDWVFECVEMHKIF